MQEECFSSLEPRPNQKNRNPGYAALNVSRNGGWNSGTVMYGMDQCINVIQLFCTVGHRALGSVISLNVLSAACRNRWEMRAVRRRYRRTGAMRAFVGEPYQERLVLRGLRVSVRGHRLLGRRGGSGLVAA